MENTQQKPKNKIISIIKNILFYFIIVSLLLFSITTIAGSKPNQVPSLFGRGFMAVESQSMESDLYANSFNKNDLIFVKVIDPKTFDFNELKKHDIITFVDARIPGKNQLNTHRIIDIDYDLKRIQTKGDNPEAPVDVINGMEYITLDKVRAIYTGKVPKVGSILLGLKTQLWFGLIVVLPIFLMLLFQGFGIVKEYYTEKNALMKEQLELEKQQTILQLKEDNKRLLDEQKEWMKQELAALKQNNNDKGEKS